MNILILFLILGIILLTSFAAANLVHYSKELLKSDYWFMWYIGWGVVLANVTILIWILSPKLISVDLTEEVTYTLDFIIGVMYGVVTVIAYFKWLNMLENKGEIE